MVSPYSFNLHFPNVQWCWTSFHVFTSYPYNALVQITDSIKNKIRLSYYGVLRLLHISWVQVFYYRYLICKYFLPISVLSFHSFINIFKRAELFNFDEVQFIQFFFHWMCFSFCSKKPLPKPKKLLGEMNLFIILIVYTDIYEITDFLLFLSRSFMVLGFTRTSMVHFEWIFVNSMDEVRIEVWGFVVDVVLHMDIQLFQHHFVEEDCPFSGELFFFFCTFVKITYTYDQKTELSKKVFCWNLKYAYTLIQQLWFLQFHLKKHKHRIKLRSWEQYYLQGKTKEHGHNLNIPW